MFICEISLTYQNVDVVEETFQASSLAVEVTKVTEDCLAEHDRELVHVFLEDFERPVF
jgi:phenylpyruvate tautomerase PptA (4-oxalocrotonate tautomerase family)